MSELEAHMILMQERRAALSGQIASLHEGDRKATLQLMLDEIDRQIEMLTTPRPMASGKAVAKFSPGSDRKRKA